MSHTVAAEGFEKLCARSHKHWLLAPAANRFERFQAKPMELLRWLPGRCLACALPTAPGHGDLCSYCFADLPWCESVLQPVAAATCTVAPLYFQGAVRDWIHRLKYHGGMVEAAVLGKVLLGAVRAHYLPLAAQLAAPQPWHALPSAIVPVPMPTRRWLQRGYNQATALAQPLAKALGLPLLQGLARSAPKAMDQHHLSRAERLQAMAERFVVNAPIPERIAIVDDVLTTGATCQALAQALLQAGAKEVHVWCATYTPP